MEYEIEQCGNGGSEKAKMRAKSTKVLKAAGISREQADEADMQWLESAMKKVGISQDLIDIEMAKKEEFLRDPKNSMLITASDRARLNREKDQQKHETRVKQRIQAEQDSKRFLTETPSPSDRQFESALKEVGESFDKFLSKNKSDLYKEFEPLAANYVQVGRSLGFSDKNIAIYIKRVSENFEKEANDATQRIRSRAVR